MSLIETLKELAAQGKTYEDAALITGRKQSNIRWMCWRYNIPLKKSDMSGINNPNYKGLRSKSYIWRTAKKAVLASGRPLNVCERCGFINKSDLPIHHLNHVRTNNKPNNLEVLCVPCHSKEHHIRGSF